jgi:hypothetical protein
MPYTYVASPYSHPEPSVRDKRFLLVGDLCHNLIDRQITPYSPIMQWHEYARRRDLPTDAKTWERVNHDMLAASSHLTICAVEGWRQSLGVKLEVEWSLELSIPIFLATFDSIKLNWNIEAYKPARPL